MLQLGAAVPGLAQRSDTNRVNPGDSVRVRMDAGSRVDAAFRRWDGDSMVLRVAGLEAPWTVSVFDMYGLEVYTDRTRREGFRHGAVLGAAGGLFIGAVVGVALNAAGVTDDPNGPSDQLVTHAIRGAVIGIAGGALAYGVYRGRHPGRGWIGLQLPSR